MVQLPLEMVLPICYQSYTCAGSLLAFTTMLLAFTTMLLTFITMLVIFATRHLATIPNVGIKRSQRGNNSFPAWEQSIPSMGILAMMLVCCRQIVKIVLRNYFTNTTRYLLEDQKCWGSSMRSIYWRLASC